MISTDPLTILTAKTAFILSSNPTIKMTPPNDTNIIAHPNHINDLSIPSELDLSFSNDSLASFEVDTDPIHFCFIVHGHRGCAADLSYLHNTLLEKATDRHLFSSVHGSEMRRREKRDRRLSRRLSRRRRRDRPTDVMANAEPCSSGSFVVHSAVCNEGKTHDGIVRGGERLAEEILQVIRREVGDTDGSIVNVTLSLVGNSLGGLYARYAVAEIARRDVGDTSDGSYSIVEGGVTIRIHFNVFCTTASPHLGTAGHTYIPLPRAAEIGIGHGMGETGRDLFRMNDLLRDMATDERFIIPLGRFRRRIAYANAFGTDFVVPVSTAAFLDKDSDSLHYFDGCIEEDEYEEEKQGVVPGNNVDRIEDTDLETVPENNVDSFVDVDEGVVPGDRVCRFEDKNEETVPGNDVSSFEDKDEGTVPRNNNYQFENKAGGTVSGNNVDSLENIDEGTVPRNNVGRSEDKEEETVAGINVNHLEDAQSGTPHLTTEVPTLEILCPASERGLVFATFHTRRVSRDQAVHSKAVEKSNELSIMSYTLDSLGWKKVFIDIRKEIPLGLTFPTRSMLPFTTNDCAIQKLKMVGQAVESRDLANMVGSNVVGSNPRRRLSLPLGHNAICAVSRGPVSSALNSGGKPVVDSLAIELTTEIPLWRLDSCD